MNRSLDLLATRSPPPESNGVPWPLQHIDPLHPPALDALYLHVPFCFHKCHYCDFYSIVDDARSGDRQEVFTRRLIAELRHRAGQLAIGQAGRRGPRTVFIGGGTPTLLRSALLANVLVEMRELGWLADVREFTVEANPETVTAEVAHVLACGGVNRVSLGAQSFQPDLLKTLERWHDPANVERAVGFLRAVGIANLNVDLIFAIPGQSLGTLTSDLDAALALGTTHLSCYGLTFEPQTAMTQRLKMGQVKAVDEELERDMYALVMDRMEAAGFEHYEVSAWARRIPPEAGNVGAAASFRCQHNLAYWTNANWLGVGPAAGSHIDGHRWKNQPHLGRYTDSASEPPIVDVEYLPVERRVGEELMLRLRLREGAPLHWLHERMSADDPRWKQLAHLRAIGMIEEHADHLRLTRRGLFVADAVIRELL